MEDNETIEGSLEVAHGDGSGEDQEMKENKTFEELFAATPPADGQGRVSRRQFLTGAVVGGAAGLAVAAGTGAVVWKVADNEISALEDANAQLQAELEVAQNASEVDLEACVKKAAEEAAKLLGLVELYEELDKIGLDGIIEKGLAAVALPLGAVEAGARALKGGLEWAENALRSVAEAVPTAQESLGWLEARVSAVADAIQKLESGVAQALNRATDNAVGEAVKELTAKILDVLPFGLGDRFRAALTGLVVLVTSVDDLVEGINTKLLEPLRENWFSADDGAGVRGTFFDPLVEKVLDPLEKHLDSLAALADAWQGELATPTETAMAERTRLRAEIARYKDEYGIT